jgi:hypothetical protein
MRAWCQRGFAVLLLLSVGVAGNLHLPFVQAVAWVRMYSHYREQFTPQQSLSITFSGQYPCGLCKLVQSAENERNNLAGMLSTTDRNLLPLTLPAAVFLPQPNVRSWRIVEPVALHALWSVGPELPPPRLA